MNKMIQRQDIVPPWIEKQQELVKTVNVFRARLRSDWRRQAVRAIASRGGTFEEQIHAAEEYARAELHHQSKEKDPSMSENSLQVFRLPAWVTAEASYLNLAISNLNSITRAYNLMAPNLARKPYFSLKRELAACYADVAPTLAAALRERATRPVQHSESGHIRPAGMLDWLHGENAGRKTLTHRARRPAYGFREWWRDHRPWGQRGGEMD